jgi:hypothetical protein
VPAHASRHCSSKGVLNESKTHSVHQLSLRLAEASQEAASASVLGSVQMVCSSVGPTAYLMGLGPIQYIS